MKKTLLIALLVVAVLSSSFAARGSSTEIMLGLSSGYGQKVMFPKDGSGEDPSTLDIVPIKVDGMFYFGDNFALNAALGMNIYPSPDFLGTVEMDTQVGFTADILAYYRLPINNMFDFLAGGGVSYNLFTISETIGNQKTTMNVHFLSLLASVRFQINATDHITAFVGGDIGYNVVNNMTMSNSVLGQTSQDLSELYNIMPWAIKAGVSYKF